MKLSFEHLVKTISDNLHNAESRSLTCQNFRIAVWNDSNWRWTPSRLCRGHEYKLNVYIMVCL